ncbi:Pentatricopeptide repeat-containing protein [Vitis vinifera]|uniref:Pentatricopeptide repeat-containing protein n=1 Tax=Vitis vinifera TaxID=29760 RepID=A0A438DZZ7_VITVI|nr:Pentatricopeptide repeat-containing protein [Vitis vinifera]
MGSFACIMLSNSYPKCSFGDEITNTLNCHFPEKFFFQTPVNVGHSRLNFGPVLVGSNVEEKGTVEMGEGEKKRYKWIEIGPNITEAQKMTISQISLKMTKRCKALVKQIICFSPEERSLSDLLAAWVKIMKPRRADWLSVLKELGRLDHPLLLEGLNVVKRTAIVESLTSHSLEACSTWGVPVAELALLEESFEANIRDYTKIIDGYGKQNRLQDAENTLSAMKRRGFICDQVTLTAMINMYSKAGNLELAEKTFEEIKLLGHPLDKRSYGSMIMAYIRAGMPDQGEILVKEMEAKEIYAGREVYKALLRAYSNTSDAEGAQRVFDAIQFAGISPDVKLCALLINAYRVAGQTQKAHVAFENMRRSGLKPNDKSIALMLAAYEKENKLNKALDFLIDLERDGIVLGKEASELLAAWFQRLGVVKEVELVLREYSAKEASCEVHPS